MDLWELVNVKSIFKKLVNNWYTIGGFQSMNAGVGGRGVCGLRIFMDDEYGPKIHFHA
jgi:hypothetical protein